MCILRGFLEARIFVFSSTQRRHSHENGQDCRFAVEMTLRGTYGGIFYRRVVVGPTELGNPHQTRGFLIPTATAATAPVLAATSTLLKSRALSDSCTEPKIHCLFPSHTTHRCTNLSDPFLLHLAAPRTKTSHSDRDQARHYSQLKAQPGALEENH